MHSLPDWILEYLRCPHSGGQLKLASQDQLERLARLVHDGKLTNAMGRTVSKISSQGLVSENGDWFYSVDEGTLCLLADEAIDLRKAAKLAS